MDVALAEVDRTLETLSGSATACVLRRQSDVFGDTRFERLGSISSAHLYNLRGSAAYLARRVVQNKTRPSTAITIGIRKAPASQNRPGFIRIDSVHQGDQDGAKGFYHINAVDCLTQWEVTASVQTICEGHLLPIIEQIMEQPNGLAETKNGAVVRKLFGYTHIPQHHASRFNAFCVEFLNPYLNYHRPCLFASEVPDPRKPAAPNASSPPRTVPAHRPSGRRATLQSSRRLASCGLLGASLPRACLVM